MNRTQALSGAVAHAAELGAEGADELRQQATRTARDSARAAQSTLKSAETWITDNPWYSVAIATGLGVLISMLLPKGYNTK